MTEHGERAKRAKGASEQAPAHEPTLLDGADDPSLEAAFGGPDGAVGAFVEAFDATEIEVVEGKQPCRIAKHAGSAWRKASGGPIVCGQCHPPVPGIEAIPVHIVAPKPEGHPTDRATP